MSSILFAVLLLISKNAILIAYLVYCSSCWHPEPWWSDLSHHLPFQLLCLSPQSLQYPMWPHSLLKCVLPSFILNDLSLFSWRKRVWPLLKVADLLWGSLPCFLSSLGTTHPHTGPYTAQSGQQWGSNWCNPTPLLCWFVTLGHVLSLHFPYLQTEKTGSSSFLGLFQIKGKYLQCLQRAAGTQSTERVRPVTGTFYGVCSPISVVNYSQISVLPH